MGCDRPGAGLGHAGLLRLYAGTQLQANGALPLAAFLLLPVGEKCEAGPDRKRVRVIFLFLICILF